MKRCISYGILATCLSFYNFAYAGYSTLKVINNVPDIEVNVTTDLNCQAIPGTQIITTRYTTPLDENPIRYNQGVVKASWKNCAILPQEYFANAGKTDHSKIYLTLLDTKSGDQFIATIQTKTGEFSREVHFSGYHATAQVNFKLDTENLTSEVTLQLDPLTVGNNKA